MSNGFKMPTHEALLEEQRSVQMGKFQARSINEYNSYIFPAQSWQSPCESAVVDLVRARLGATGCIDLQSTLVGLCSEPAKRPVSWVDMAGGYAMPMRYVGSSAQARVDIKMTNVDLLDCKISDFSPRQLATLESARAGITDPEAAPELVLDNVETVTLSERADIITCVEAVQYLNNPLGAIANWYNQLVDDGLLLIAADHDWSDYLQYQQEAQDYERYYTPSVHLLQALGEAGIKVAATKYQDTERGVRPQLDPTRFKILAVQKKPGTTLEIIQPVVDVHVNHSDFKIAYYQAPVRGEAQLINVVPVSHKGVT